MASEKINYELNGRVAHIHMDDGKVNALSHETIGALVESLDRAETEADAVLISGREGKFCGGFDLSVMTAGTDAASRLVTAGAELLLKTYTFPKPVVVACTGHALAAGALVLLSGDLRVGAKGDFKIGLNEVAISMTLPVFAMELGRDRLSKRHFTSATTQARIFDPKTAVDAGFLDWVESDDRLLGSAMYHAERLAGLPQPALGATKARERMATVRKIRESLEDDMAGRYEP